MLAGRVIRVCGFVVALIAVGVGAFLFGIKHRDRVTDERHRIYKMGVDRSELAEIRSLSIRLEPRLATETSQLQIALLLRNLIHQRVVSKWGTDAKLAPFRFTDLADSYRKSLLDPTYTHACGGLTVEYLTALRAFGIVARKVAMYPAVSDLPDIAISHASVEVLINDEWVASDPTFNASLTDGSGRHIGWFFARDLWRAEETVSITTDGFQVASNTLQGYFETTSPQKMTKYINTSPYWDGQQTVFARKLPNNWDGVLRYKNGNNYDAFKEDASVVYNLLASQL